MEQLEVRRAAPMIVEKQRQDTTKPPLKIDERVEKWLRETYVEDREGLILCAELYSDYEDFCGTVGVKPYSNTIFGKLLLRVFDPKLVKRSKRKTPQSKEVRIPFYKGLALRNPPSSQQTSEQHFYQHHVPYPPQYLQPLHHPQQGFDAQQPQKQHFPESNLLPHLRSVFPPRRLWTERDVKYVYKEDVTETALVEMYDNGKEIVMKEEEEVEEEEEEEEEETREYHMDMETNVLGIYHHKDAMEEDEIETKYNHIVPTQRGIGVYFVNPEPGKVDTVSQRIVNSFGTFYHHCLVQDQTRIQQCKLFLMAFAEVQWPLLPVPWCIVNGDIVDMYYRMGGTEKSIVELNVCVALLVGAEVLGYYDIARDLYETAKDMMTLLHDCLDLNVIPALSYMAVNAFWVFEPAKAMSLALSYILVAETVLEAKNAQNTELYVKTMNLKSWLTSGDSDILVNESVDIAETLDESASKELRTEYERIVHTRKLVLSSMMQRSYLEYKTLKIRRLKLRDKTFVPIEEDPAGHVRQMQIANYVNECKPLRRTGKKALKDIEGKVSARCFVVLKNMYIAAMVESYYQAGKFKKALKFARQCMDLVESPDGVLFCFLHFKEFPNILAEAQAWTDLKRFVQMANRYSSFYMPALLRDMANGKFPTRM